MARAVFTASVSPSYDDLPEERYHFPRTYLRAVEAAVGDEIVYYEPRRTAGGDSTGGRQAYFAIAQVDGIDPDPNLADHFYARISRFIAFDRPVPFREGTRYYESALRKPDGSTNKGAFGRAVRLLPAEEFVAIAQAGFARSLDLEPATRVADRRWVEVRRPVRDRAFLLRLRDAYDNACAMTGLRIVNGGGWTEAQAAHIRPVKDAGPDSVRNGLLLSSTMHALFDRGFITVQDDFKIVLARVGVPPPIEALLPRDRRLRVPPRIDERPHPAFLRWHREHVFKRA